MRKWIVVGLIVLAALVSTLIARSFQSPAIRAVDEAILREYAGTYQWDRNAFVYLQIWPELTGTNQLVAFDETGELRILYPSAPDRFFTGPGAAIPTPVESRIEVQRADSGKIASLTWSREGAPARTARRVDTERREDVRFSNGDVQLAGTLISPTTQGPHPAVILVHASGAEDREYLLPFARFLIRHGMAVLGYDKRGVGASTGDWNKASFDDLAGDVVAAFEYPEVPQRYPACRDRHVGMEPSRMGDAPGRDAGEGPCFPHQHLWRGSVWRRDDDRSGAKRDGG